MKKVLGIAAAAIAGYVAGVLVAPKSGKETREDLMQKKDELGAQAADKKAQAKEVFDESSEAVKKGASDISSEAASFGKKAKTSAEKVSKEASKLGTQGKRSLGRMSDTAAKTSKEVSSSVNKLR